MQQNLRNLEDWLYGSLMPIALLVGGFPADLVILDELGYLPFSQAGGASQLRRMAECLWR